MKNNSEKTIIACSIRPFDCEWYKHENLCGLSETDCCYAILNKKEERIEKLKIVNDIK